MPEYIYIKLVEACICAQLGMGGQSLSSDLTFFTPMSACFAITYLFAKW
jgi:hypothetical protein